MTVYEAVKSSKVGFLAAVRDLRRLRPRSPGGAIRQDPRRDRGRRRPGRRIEKLEIATELGADYVVNAAEQDPGRDPEAGGADAAIAPAVSPRPFEQALDSLARSGTLMIVALPPDNLAKLPIFETVLRGINISRVDRRDPPGR